MHTDVINVQPMSVVFVAPYAPDVPSRHLGAARKIELIIGLLSSLGFRVHLVDSSHSSERWTRAIFGDECQVGETKVSLWRPVLLRKRAIGKLVHVAFAARFARKLSRTKPTVVWLYNSYAFEARVGLSLKAATGAKLVLELEDLPMARRRSLNVKPWLDQAYFNPLLHAADLVTFVNASIMERFGGSKRNTLLLPSILKQALVDRPMPRRFQSSAVRIGYFGGLEADKGADLLLKFAWAMPSGWKLVVTGAGSLSPAFASAAANGAGALEFHGRVGDDTLVDLMFGCDVIVNPHSSIAGMDDGVFPFKVCEALASGALLVSTPLPKIDIPVVAAAIWFDGTLPDLVEKLSSARAFYAANYSQIVDACEMVRARYSEASISAAISSHLRLSLGLTELVA